MEHKPRWCDYTVGAQVRLGGMGRVIGRTRTELSVLWDNGSTVRMPKDVVMDDLEIIDGNETYQEVSPNET